MPRNETILQVFVASPGDLAEERDALEDVISELNITWSQNLRYRLELVRWETHAVPGVGEDAQDVVNLTVPQDYDIFIGMLWSRFGTPTNRADSGTQEEFETAFEKHSNDSESIDILFYFKDKPVAISQIDPEQLQLIHDFQKRIRQLGCLYGNFTEVSEFKDLVRLHLSRLVQKWQTKTSHASFPPEIDPPSRDSSSDTLEAEEEEGLVDLLEQAEDGMAKLTELANRMENAIDELGKKMVQRTSEINALSTKSGSSHMKAVKRIAGVAASDLDDYVARTEIDVPIFAEALSVTMGSFGRAASLSMEFQRDDTKDLEEVRGTMGSLKESLITSKSSIQSLRDALSEMPKITSAYNKSKRKGLFTLDALLSVFEAGVSHVSDLEITLDEIIGRFSASGEESSI